MSLRSISQGNLAAGGAKIGVPVPQIQCHAGSRQRIRDHYSPEGEQLVGALREHLEQPIKEHLEYQKDRKQGVPHYWVAHSPVDQHDQTHPEQREDGEVESGIDQYGTKDQMSGVGSGVAEQDDLPQETRGLKGVPCDRIEEEEPGSDGETTQDPDIRPFSHGGVAVFQHALPPEQALVMPLTDACITLGPESPERKTRGRSYPIESPRALPGGWGGGLTSAPRAAWSKVPRRPGCLRQSRNAIDPIPSTLPMVEVSQGNRLSVRE